MELKNYIKEHKDQLTEDKLFKITCLLSKVIDNHVDDHIDKMKRKVWCIISDGHYNKEFALEDVKKMYYELGEVKHSAPYWDLEFVERLYNSSKGEYPILNNYNVYDFYVTINMIKSDNYKLYKNRFRNYSDSDLNRIFLEDTINWLDDADNPYGTSKIWKYLNN